MTERTGLDAMRAAVAALNADELPYLEVTWRAYTADPFEHDRGSRLDRPLGAGIPADQLAAWTPLVIAFVAQVVATMAVEAGAGRVARTGRGLLVRWRSRRAERRARQRAGAQPLPRFTPEQLAGIRAAAARAAAGAGRGESDQARFAAVIVLVLSVDAPAPPGPRP
ncbi:hypothetical protein [Dactylosporangium sp. CA-092794]|uniref:hypothetical protein n=1 Tax=Dactylosporangium sp. CA-092794 TaxID=3239929 RepID=UPI003D8C2F69